MAANVDITSPRCHDAAQISGTDVRLTEIFMRNRKLTLSIATVALLVMALNAFAGDEAAAKSAVGIWKLDLAKSSFGKTPAPKYEQMVVSKDDPTAIKWTVTGANPEGKSYSESYDGPIDSKDHNVKVLIGNGPATIAYTRTASGGLEWTVKDAKGSIVETGVGQLSPDGKTLTLKGTMAGPKGKDNFIAVYNRMK